MLIQEDQKHEQETHRDRQRSLLMPKPLALAAPDLIVVRPHCNLPQYYVGADTYALLRQEWRVAELEMSDDCGVDS
jgi:hypothetical protein